LVGGPANTTYGENTGVLAITKNYDPSILRLTAIFAIILAFISKIGSVLTSIPQAVMGGISIMLFSMIALVGVKTVKNSKVKLNFSNTLVMVTILVLGLFSTKISEMTGIVIGIPISETVQITGLSFAALVGIVLNLILTKLNNN
jgi:Xanthine/uracil permeases